jgi:type IV pilus assembly protein PilW
MLLMRHAHQRGLTLIELMIAVGLGITVLLAVSSIFANSSRSRMEMEKSNRQTENGRYAMQLLTNNLRMAGYLAEFDPTPLTTTALTAVPDPCATNISDLLDALPLHVQGINDASSGPSCLSDLKSGTDILVIRRASSCSVGQANCDAMETGTPYFQASLCTPTDGTELAAKIDSNQSNASYAANYFTLSTNSGDFNKHKTDCTTVAPVSRYHVDIFFIANNNEAGDGIPTLKRAELSSGTFTITPLVDGIEDMQISYGIDLDNNGTPDVYSESPGSYGGCGGSACITNWRNTMSANISLLSRNTEPTVGYSDNRTYTLGLNENGSEKTVGPFGDNYKRHVFSTTALFANPAWRRQ